MCHHAGEIESVLLLLPQVDVGITEVCGRGDARASRSFEDADDVLALAILGEDAE